MKKLTENSGILNVFAMREEYLIEYPEHLINIARNNKKRIRLRIIILFSI